MLNKNKFVVKQQTKVLSAKQAYDIMDGDSGQALGTATTKTGALAAILGLVLGKDKMPLTLEFRQKSDNGVLFSIRRSGLLFKKVRLVDAQGQVLGSYQAKRFSLSGGFHVYDKDGKHIADIKGKMFKSEYAFVSPKEGTEMGSVSRKWGGVAKELLTEAGTYGVQIAPVCANNLTAKMLILGAAVAIDAIFKKKGGKGGKGAEDEGDEGSGGDE